LHTRVLLIAAIALALCGWGWFLTVAPTGTAARIAHKSNAPTTEGNDGAAAANQAPRERELPPPESEIAVEPPLAPALELGNELLTWEQRIAAVTQSGALNESAKAKHLLDMLPGLPEEALETAAREAIKRLPDKEYAAARARLINPQTHGRVLSVLLEDLMERPDEITLPTLLSVARTPAHPLSEAARANLELLLGKNVGADWPKWETEIRRALSGEHN